MYVQLLEFYLYIGERNENHFIVATQDAELQSKLRDIPGQSFAKNCKCFYYACVRIIAVALWPWQVYVRICNRNRKAQLLIRTSGVAC